MPKRATEGSVLPAVRAVDMSDVAGARHELPCRGEVPKGAFGVLGLIVRREGNRVVHEIFELLLSNEPAHPVEFNNQRLSAPPIPQSRHVGAEKALQAFAMVLTGKLPIQQANSDAALGKATSDIERQVALR